MRSKKKNTQRLRKKGKKKVKREALIKHSSLVIQRYIGNK
jgi:hypothetical protein